MTEDPARVVGVGVTLVKRIHEIISWKSRGVWWILLLNKSMMSVLRNLKVLAHHDQIMLDTLGNSQ